jgi:hypothetical protein
MAVHRRKRRQSSVGLAAAVSGLKIFDADPNPSGGQTTVILTVQATDVSIGTQDLAELGRSYIWDMVRQVWGQCIAAEILSVDPTGSLVQLTFDIAVTSSDDCETYIPSHWPVVGGPLGSQLEGYSNTRLVSHIGTAATREGYLIIPSTQNSPVLLFDTVQSMIHLGFGLVEFTTSNNWLADWTVSVPNVFQSSTGASGASAGTLTGTTFEIQFSATLSSGEFIWLNDITSDIIKTDGVHLLPFTLAIP